MHGNLILQVENTLEFLKENLSFKHAIDERGKRVDKYEVPIEVLREAVANAVVHRDYETPSPIYIKVFDDRIEVSNPGKLMPPLTPEKLKGEHPSILRNPKIANVFFLYGFIERWGRGTNKMVELCLKKGLKEPVFQEENNLFKAIIFRETLNELGKRVYELVKQNVNTSAMIAESLGINERTARKHLSNLVSKGLIFRRKIGRKVFYSTELSQ